MWTWLVAQDYEGTDGLVIEACADRTISRFKTFAEDRGASLNYIKRPHGHHWDGSRIDRAETKKITRGMLRNGHLDQNDAT